jgi:hypothetical protein
VAAKLLVVKGPNPADTASASQPQSHRQLSYSALGQGRHPLAPSLRPEGRVELADVSRQLITTTDRRVNLPADRLDAEALPVGVDVGDDHLTRRSGSA